MISDEFAAQVVPALDRINGFICGEIPIIFALQVKLFSFTVIVFHSHLLYTFQC